jgi:hypothetical protein
MAKFPRLAGVNHALKGTVILLLLATSLPSAAESDYLVGLRQSSLLNAGEGLVEGDSQEQLRQL